MTRREAVCVFVAAICVGLLAGVAVWPEAIPTAKQQAARVFEPSPVAEAEAEERTQITVPPEPKPEPVPEPIRKAPVEKSAEPAPMPRKAEPAPTVHAITGEVKEYSAASLNEIYGRTILARIQDTTTNRGYWVMLPLNIKTTEQAEATYPVGVNRRFHFLLFVYLASGVPVFKLLDADDEVRG